MIKQMRQSSSSSKSIFRFVFLLYCLAEGTGVWAQHRPTISLDPSEILADAYALTAAYQSQVFDKIRIHPGDRVSIMGDSITAAGGYIRLAEAVLKINYPNLKLPPFVNAGVGGQRAEDMQPRFAHDMHLADRPAWVFISVGINDVWHRLGQPHDFAVLEAYRSNVTSMVEQSQAAGAQVVLLTPTLISEDSEAEGNKRLAKYVEVMKKIGAKKACGVIDLHELFLESLQHKTPGVPLTSDGVHMAIYGDAIMAIGILRALGIPDSVIIKTDTFSLLQCRAWNMSAKRLTELLEIPPSRFAKADLLRGFSF